MLFDWDGLDYSVTIIKGEIKFAHDTPIDRGVPGYILGEPWLR